MTRPRKRPGIGVLPLLAALFLVSGIVRLGLGATAVLANGPEPDLAAVPPGCTAPGADLLAAFAERESRLAARETQVADRQQALNVAEVEVAQKLAELVAAETSLAATLALAETAAEDDLGRLTAVYEAMKPQEAAALFQAMAPEFAAGFLGRMRPEPAAAIMAGLDPTTAYSISVILAGRNANVPTE